jgi:hypothetical protein
MFQLRLRNISQLVTINKGNSTCMAAYRLAYVHINGSMFKACKTIKEKALEDPNSKRCGKLSICLVRAAI